MNPGNRLIIIWANMTYQIMDRYIPSIHCLDSSSTKNPFWPVNFLFDWSLHFIIIIMVLLHHVIVYYITKFHYSRLLYLITSWLLISYCSYCSLSIFILFFYKIYFLASNSIWTCVAFVTLSRICVIVFIFIFIVIYPALSLEPKMFGKDQQFHCFYPLETDENMF